MTDVGSRLVLY